MVDYREAVTSSEKPNPIFGKVLEDNRKFGVENDVYSTDFFDFMLAIQTSVASMDETDESTKKIRDLAVEIGSKSTLEILAKALNNSRIDEHVQVLAQLLLSDPSNKLLEDFLGSWYEKDGFNFLF